MFGSPLTQLRHVMRSKSSESMPRALSVMSVVTSGAWLCYGVLRSDPFVVWPNLAGLVLGLLQLLLIFVIYPAPHSIV
jgi:solute carrier family 50 protein (sugar transporter)